MLIPNRWKRRGRRLYLKAVTRKRPSVDVVVCVHNQVDIFAECLGALLKYWDYAGQLIIVDDGSILEESEKLFELVKGRAYINLLRHEVAQGYTASANRGLRASRSDYVILMNSDAVVVRHTLQALVMGLEDNQKYSALGPLSNAASWQNVPVLCDEDGSWSINEYPEDLNSEFIGKKLTETYGRTKPVRVPLLNGVMTCFRRQVFESIGYLDEDNFPSGYGEENDWCIRAGKRGYRLGVSLRAYLFHHKSKSFGSERRKRLVDKNGKRLEELHGKQKISGMVKRLRSNKHLASARDVVSSIYGSFPEGVVSGEFEAKSSVRVLYLLQAHPGSGGVLSVVQESRKLNELGAMARVAIPLVERPLYQKHFHGEEIDHLIFYRTEEEFLALASTFDYVVATIWTSVDLVNQAVESSSVRGAYYVQDFEPDFYEKNDPRHSLAMETYNTGRDWLVFVKTRWLKGQLQEKVNLTAMTVRPSLDKDVFFNTDSIRLGERNVLVAMIRPSTPRRNPEGTMRVLKVLAESYSDFEIRTFGCDEHEIAKWEIRRYANWRHLGRLRSVEVADLFRSSDLFIDLSYFQAFGRAALEAAACGCAVLVSENSGCIEFFEKGVSAVCVNVEDEDTIVRSICDTVANDALLATLKRRAKAVSEGFDLEASAESILGLLKRSNG
ncbi:MAG: glycosyltransferase [Opitutales bacterium]